MRNFATTSIESAIIPAAGFGTRLRPLTYAIPKEMLPIGRKPVLEHVVAELRESGISKLLFVISPGKEMISNYFGDGAKWGVSCEYAVQHEMKGLGDAILCGASWAKDAPVLVAFGDCMIESEQAQATKRLISTFVTQGADGAVITERIAPERTSKYGILAPANPLPDEPIEPFALRDIVEKPAPDDAPSTMAVAARWALSADVFEGLRSARPGSNGEVNLTDTVRRMIAKGANVWGVPLKPGEARRDIGGWDTYFIATTRAALNDPECGEMVRNAIGS